jgi:hypothetical protein
MSAKQYYLIKSLDPQKSSHEVVNLIPNSKNLTDQEVEELIKSKGLQKGRVVYKNFEIWR